MRDKPMDPDLSGFVFDERFVAEAAHKEPAPGVPLR